MQLFKITIDRTLPRRSATLRRLVGRGLEHYAGWGWLLFVAGNLPLVSLVGIWVLNTNYTFHETLVFEGFVFMALAMTAVAALLGYWRWGRLQERWEAFEKGELFEAKILRREVKRGYCYLEVVFERDDDFFRHKLTLIDDELWVDDLVVGTDIIGFFDNERRSYFFPLEVGVWLKFKT